MVYNWDQIDGRVLPWPYHFPVVQKNSLEFRSRNASAAFKIAHSAAPWELIQILLFQLLAQGLDGIYLYTRYGIDRRCVWKDMRVARRRETVVVMG